MHDSVGGGGDQQHTTPGGGSSDPKVLVATTLAALVLAGSAYIWRSGTIPTLKDVGRSTGLLRDEDDRSGVLVTALAGSSSRRDSIGKTDPSALRASASVRGEAALKRRASQVKGERDFAASFDAKHDAAGASSSQGLQEAGGSGTAVSLGRTSRPKERRRRGKDPTKDLFKSGKLNKAIPISNTGKTKSDVASPVVGHGQHQTSPSPSRSRVSSESYGQSSTPRPQRRSSRSSSRILSPSRQPLSDTTGIYNSPSLQTSRLQQRSCSRSRSRSRSRPEPSSEPAESITDCSPSRSDHHPPGSPRAYTLNSLTTSTANNDAASTTSASSSEATEATASTTSTAPSSLTSPTTIRQLNSDRLNDSDGTPKAESVNSAKRTSSQGSNRLSGGGKTPWDWDGIVEFNSSPSGPTNGTTKPPRIQPKANDDSGTSSSSEVMSGNAPLPYASIVSASGKSSTSSHPGKAGSLERASSPSSGRYEVDEGGLDEAEEITFPSLNNPDSSSPSPYSTGANSVASSVSRPQSRASTSSASSSKGKPKHSRGISGLAPLSTKHSTPPIASTSTGVARRAPTPSGRPGSPSSSSSPSVHPPPSPSSPYHNPAYLNSGTTVTLSAQTQLASLRGALEAARLREEKSKNELEKVTRESDALRWENVAWRRREGELQSHIQQMAHQMQVYANYIASINHHAATSQIQPTPVPPALSASAVTSPAQTTETDVGSALTGPDNEESSEKLESDNVTEQSGANSRLNATGSEGSSSTSVPGQVSPHPNDEGSDLTVEPTTDDPGSSKDAADQSVSPSSHPPALSPVIRPPSAVPFAPQPIPGHLPPMSPMGGAFSHLHSPFIHHPGTPGPQSPAGLQHSFGFPHLSQHQPGGPHPQQGLHLPPFPIMPLGLSGMAPGGHMQPLQSPIPHPGMMMMHPGPSGLHQHPFGAGSGSSSSAGGFPPLTPTTHGSVGSNMGIGMMSGMAPSHPSPLWMNGIVNGSANTPSSKLASLGSISPDVLSGPSSPMPNTFFERGRKGRGGGKRGSVEEHGEVSRHPDDAVEHEYDRGDDEDEGEFNSVLADAILKRPSSIRMGSGSGKRRNSSYGRDKSVLGLAGSVSLNEVWSGSSASALNGLGQGSVGSSGEREGEQEEVEEEQREFTFPSLSELGNVAREKRVGTPAPGEPSGNGREQAKASSVPSTSNPVVDVPLADMIVKSESDPSSLTSEPASIVQE